MDDEIEIPALLAAYRIVADGGIGLRTDLHKEVAAFKKRDPDAWLKEFRAMEIKVLELQEARIRRMELQRWDGKGPCPGCDRGPDEPKERTRDKGTEEAKRLIAQILGEA